MKCEWVSVLDVLPLWLRDSVDKFRDEGLEEIRLRLGLFPELDFGCRRSKVFRPVKSEDLTFCLNIASKYSPWSASTVAKGFITVRGGHRIGICGSVIVKDGTVTGMDNITSLCIRISRDFTDIAKEIANSSGSVLIIGQPGSGKTTLLRDLIRQRAKLRGDTVCVVDEREELFPKNGNDFCFPTGYGVDVISGASKKDGIEAVLRSMGPDVIAVDEISAAEDCDALLRSGWCGVHLIASAHASDKADLKQRTVYRPILEMGLFDTLVVLNKQKKWHIERMVE